MSHDCFHTPQGGSIVAHGVIPCFADAALSPRREEQVNKLQQIQMSGGMFVI